MAMIILRRIVPPSRRQAQGGAQSGELSALRGLGEIPEHPVLRVGEPADQFLAHTTVYRLILRLPNPFPAAVLPAADASAIGFRRLRRCVRARSAS